MPSPFPGMDPYLENPGLWPGVHGRLIAVISDALSARLRPRYWVDIEERLYVEREDSPSRAIRPDLVVSAPPGTRGGASSTAIAAEYVEVTEVIDVPVKETYLVVRSLPGREVVTVIELLSPTNKDSHNVGMGEYLRKREEVLSSKSNLVEIDLLREGVRPAYHGVLSPHEYLVLVHRGWERPKAWARGWRLGEAIPQVPIPLAPSEEAVLLDLGEALQRVYDRGAYDLVLDYARPPEPPLAEEEHAWAQKLLAGRPRPRA